WPSPQPYFVPVRSRSSRSTLSSVRSGSASIGRRFPLTSRWVMRAILLFSRNGVSPGVPTGILPVGSRNRATAAPAGTSGGAYQADPECPIFDELRSIVAKLAPKSRCSQTILVVEDQPATAQITRILLESWGYRVLEARGGVEALGIYDQCDGAIDLLLTDVIMPGMNGPQLAEELLNRNPELRIVYMSG